MPRWPQKDELNSQELPLNQDKEVVLPASGSIQGALDELRTVEVHDKPLQDDYAAALAFSEEKVTVMIHDDVSPNAENPVQVAVNGINQFFLRGQPITVKRKYVEVLARCKRTTISTPEVTDGSGARTNVVRQSNALRYPFSILQDANPKGAGWLREILASP